MYKKRVYFEGAKRSTNRHISKKRNKNWLYASSALLIIASSFAPATSTFATTAPAATVAENGTATATVDSAPVTSSSSQVTKSSETTANATSSSTKISETTANTASSSTKISETTTNTASSSTKSSTVSSEKTSATSTEIAGNSTAVRDTGSISVPSQTTLDGNTSSSFSFLNGLTLTGNGVTLDPNNMPSNTPGGWVLFITITDDSDGSQIYSWNVGQSDGEPLSSFHFPGQFGRYGVGPSRDYTVKYSWYYGGSTGSTAVQHVHLAAGHVLLESNSPLEFAYGDNGVTFDQPTDPVRSGYTFAGWYSDSSLTQKFDFKTPITALQTTIYSKFVADNIKQYTITYDTQGGTSINSDTVNEGTVFKEPTETVSKSGYSFAGWYTDPAGTQLYSFSTPATSNVTLYAKWTPINVAPPTTDNKPIISGKTAIINVGDTWKVMDNLESAYDYEDGYITSNVKMVSNDVNTSKAGIYHVTYSVTDSAGNTTEETFEIKVYDVNGTVSGKTTTPTQPSSKNPVVPAPIINHPNTDSDKKITVKKIAPVIPIAVSSAKTLPKTGEKDATLETVAGTLLLAGLVTYTFLRKRKTI